MDENVKERKMHVKISRKFWNGFRMISPNSAIIQGSFALSDKRFKLSSRGLQAVPCCVTAIVFNSLLNPEDWNRNFVDRVLLYGDRLFHISRLRNRVDGSNHMTTSLVYPEFFIEDYKCKICVKEGVVYGNLFSGNNHCPDLTNGIRNFFTFYESGILTTQGSSVAIWHLSHDQFFCFNPTPAADGTNCLHGVACIMRFKDLNAMLDSIVKNLNKNCDSKYAIDRISISELISVRKSVLLFPDRNKIPGESQTICQSPEKSAVTISKVQRVPLSVTISSSNIIEQNAEKFLDIQNTFNTNYTYSDMRINIPSTFKPLSNNIWILHGWTHENSEVYKGKGAQNVVNCLMSIAMKKMFPAKTWLRTTLDEILTLGDKVYAQFKTDHPNVKELTAGDLNGTKVEIKNEKMVANVDIMTIIGMLSSRTPFVLDLKTAVKEFFVVNNCGIVETSMMVAAIWMEDEYYYMFDSRQCDANGFRVVDEKKKGKSTKKDKDKKEEKKVSGKCCVIRFSDTNDLTIHFIKNIPFGKKNDRFFIRNIEIVSDEPGKQPWHYFKPGELINSWLLTGSFFGDRNILDDENHSLAISTVCLIFAKKIIPSEWSKEIVDDVIHEGNEYYKWCIPDEEDRKFDFQSLKSVLYINNQKVNLELEEAAVVGNIFINNPENRYLNIEEGITQFFENYQSGIFEVNGITFAIWKELDPKETSMPAYYLFVINLKTQGNSADDKEPVSCLIRILSLENMAKIIDSNIEYSVEEDLQFLIHNVNILQIGDLMTDEDIEKEKQTILKPELYQYSNINEETACLNGSINQGNEGVFSFETRDKQQAGNAIVTLAMTKFYNPHLWSKQIIDDILKMGDKITNESLDNLPMPSEGEIKRTWLLPKEITNEFNVGVNHINFELQEDFVTGKLNNLSKVVDEFFAEKTMGIFRIGNIIMPIWKQGSVFFTMDPIGRDSQGVPMEKNGVASVLWFTSTSVLASDLNAMAGNENDTDFSIDNISINNNYETRLTDRKESQEKFSSQDMWYNFAKQSDGVWYIDGNIQFTDEKFNEENQGKQSAAIAIMAILFSKIYSPRRWSAKVLDEVIITGDKLHKNCAATFGTNAIPRVNQIINEFFLSDRRINLFITDCVQSGGYDNDTSKIEDALIGVGKFFDQYPSGILTINNDINIAIWKFEDFYYFLLPSTSRLMRFAKTTDLINQLLADFSILDYEIVAVEVSNWNKMPPWRFDPSSIIHPLNLPPLNAFKRLQGAARALLSSSSQQQDSEYLCDKIRQLQAAANCIVALGMSVVKSPDTWTRSTLDTVLSVGNSLYHESLKAQPGKEKLKPEDIIRIFPLGRNVLTVDVSVPVISGQVSIPPPEPEVKGKKKPAKKADRKKKKGKVKRESPAPSAPILLEDGIKQFFENHSAGVLVIGRFQVSIWKQLGVYFIYVSFARNNQALKIGMCSSYVAWFACMEPFYDLIYSSLDDSEKYIMYEIRSVLFRTTAIKTLPYSVDLKVCEFITASTLSASTTKRIALSGIKTINSYIHDHRELSILRGRRNMNDVMFPERNRGLQSTAICAVAIVIGAIYVPSSWTPDVIDAILLYGDLLHHDSCRLLGISLRNLSPCELHSVFVVGDFRAQIHVHPYTMTGLLYPYDVAETLRFFFKSNTCGILHTNIVSMAVAQHYGRFYLFDPCRRSKKSSHSDEQAYVMKFSSITVLAHVFVTRCFSNKTNVYTLNPVNVLSLYSFSNISGNLRVL